MPATEPARILAIDPGTRQMGVAVMDGAALVHHGVAVIKKGHSPHETLDRGRAIVAGLISHFHPDILVFEQTFVGRNRRLALLNVFADEIKALGKRNRLRVTTIAPSTVKKAITGNGWARKEDVARAVVSRYPELKAYLLNVPDVPKWKQLFHCNMFDAVALGLVCATSMTPTNQSSAHTPSGGLMDGAMERGKWG